MQKVDSDSRERPHGRSFREVVLPFQSTTGSRVGIAFHSKQTLGI